MPSPTDPDKALALVHEGWNQLQLQRPLAAWASWHRALRLMPDDPAASQALATLESAAELPAAARNVPRFQAPSDSVRRVRWDTRFQGRDLGDLADAADVFAALVADDPADASAWSNHALCLAWQGRNAEAVASLDRVVRVQARDHFDRAVDAWTLAEVLRQGAGAERLADDLRYAWVLEWPGGNAPRLPGDRPWLLPVATPSDPTTGRPQVAEAQVFEWLDRPLATTAQEVRSGADLPRLLATVVSTPLALRLSSPDPRTLDALHERLIALIGAVPLSFRREAVPLPLHLLDAAVWTFRLPRGVDREAERSLTRAAVEHYYEDLWIHQPRQGLDNRSPLDVSRLAHGGDAEARAKLTAVIRLREQLGARPRTAALYQGYPFDRLRRRLGLEPDDNASTDARDLTCAGEEELDQLDPAALDDARLIEAYLSSFFLRDDARAARFAAALIRRNPPSLADLTAPPLFATLVREAMRAHRPDEALRWLDQARTLQGGRERRTFDTWTAEIQARTGQPDAAVRIYESLLNDATADAALALDAAETLLDNGYAAHARPLLRRAHDQARNSGDHAVEDKARVLLDQGDWLDEEESDA
jgi:tetratricopeptide (TPR) repeat protein